MILAPHIGDFTIRPKFAKESAGSQFSHINYTSAKKKLTHMVGHVRRVTAEANSGREFYPASPLVRIKKTVGLVMNVTRRYKDKFCHQNHAHLLLSP